MNHPQHPGIHFSTLLFAGLLASAQTVAALTIDFDYSFDSSNFFAAGSQARTTLEAAGSFYASRITDDLLAIDSAGINHLDALFSNPSTGLQTQISNLDLAANTIRIIPGARNLGGSVLGAAAAGGSSTSGSAQFLLDAATRGQGGYTDVFGSSAHEYSLWGGAIAFDSDTNWNFALDNAPPAGQFDFLTVALHEFGHIFGVGVAASWYSRITPAFLFGGSAAVAEYGGSVPLQAGSGQHWQDGVSNTVAAGPEAFIHNAGAVQETSYDPTITNGTRKLVTDLDLAVLRDIGWEIAPPQPPPPDAPLQVPVPLGASLVAAMGMLLAGVRLLRAVERGRRPARKF